MTAILRSAPYHNQWRIVVDPVAGRLVLKIDCRPSPNPYLPRTDDADLVDRPAWRLPKQTGHPPVNRHRRGQVRRGRQSLPMPVGRTSSPSGRFGGCAGCTSSCPFAPSLASNSYALAASLVVKTVRHLPARSWLTKYVGSVSHRRFVLGLASSILPLVPNFLSSVPASVSLWVARISRHMPFLNSLTIRARQLWAAACRS